MKWGRLCILAFIIMCGSILYSCPPVSAESLKIQPTLVQSSLKKGEKKKGFVDISNPSNEPVTIKLSVESFRQINDEGGLSFSKNEQITEGIGLDLESVQLQPKDVIRLYYIVDGTKLPEGDVFAALFAETVPTKKPGASSLSARVGTLLILQNGTPSSHEAEVVDVKSPLFQIGNTLSFDSTIRNPATVGEETGFFPNLTVRYGPYDKQESKGPLLFAGRQRTVTFKSSTSYFGILDVSVSAGSNTKSTRIFVITGFWRWVAPLMLVAIIIVTFGAASIYRWRQKHI